MNRGLRWTLLASALLLALAVLGAAWGVRVAERESREAWTVDLGVAAEDASARVAAWLEGTRRIGRLAAAFPTAVWLASGRPTEPRTYPADVGAEEHARRLLDSLCEEAGLESVLLVGRGGKILAEGGHVRPIDRDPAPLGEFAGRALPSLEFDSEEGAPSIRVVEPVHTIGGEELVGALVARQDARRPLLAALAWPARSASTGETFLLERKDGAVRVLSSRAAGRGFQSAESLGSELGALLGLLSVGGARVGASPADAVEPRIGAYAPVSGVPWGVAMTISRAEAAGGRGTEIVATVAAAALALIVALLGGVVFQERRRARRDTEAHARDARLVSAIERTRDVALFVQEDGTVVEALGATHRIYGSPPASLVGRRLDELRAPDTRAALATAGRARGANGMLSEETHLRADGSLSPVELSTSPVAGEDGHRWYLAIVRDVTARRASEEATRTLVRVVEQSPVSIVITDLRGEIQYVNPRFCEVTGYAAAEVVGQNPRILKSGMTPDAVYAELWRTISAGRVWQGELVNRRKDGTHFTEHASVAPVADAHGVVTHFVAVKEDLTERRALEDRATTAEAGYLQAQKLEGVGQLASGVAHDFNNLLCVILGYGQLVVEELGPDHAQTSRVELIVQAGRSAEALTRQLLAFSRRRVVRPELLDLNHAVHAVEQILRRLIGESIILVVELAPAPAVVCADAGQVEQILINLAVNARDAMQQGGRLTIRTALEPGGGRPGSSDGEVPVGPWAVLVVADTGCGMDAATQARLGEPFFTTKPLGVGTGIGLATVYGIVQQGGGHVRLTSAPGRGTEFRVFLPRVAREAEQVEHPDADLHAYVGTETVLVVEDQEPVRTIVRLWLERRGYRVLEAPDGRAGMAIASDATVAIDLLLSDVVMPGASGVELAAAARAPRSDLPVIFMSGYTSDVIAQQGALGACTRLLEKPLSEAILVRAVRETLDTSKRSHTPEDAAPA